MSANPVEAFGFSAVPRSLSKLLENTDKKNNRPLLVEDLPLPHSDNVAKKAHEYAKEHLSQQTFNHSMRVFLWGMLHSFILLCTVYVPCNMSRLHVAVFHSVPSPDPHRDWIQVWTRLTDSIDRLRTTPKPSS